MAKAIQKLTPSHTVTGKLRCQARLSPGVQCKRPVVPGQPVCSTHGGRAGRPPVHGLSAKLPTDRFDEAYNELLADPGLLSLREEAATVRAWVRQYREEVVRSGGLTSEHLPALRDWLETAGKLIERAHKLEHGLQYTISLTNLAVILARVGEVINAGIDSGAVGHALKHRIAEGLRAVVGRSAYISTGLDALPVPEVVDDDEDGDD